MIATLEDFSERICALLGIDVVGVANPHDSIFDSWGLDSLQAFQMLIIIESLANVSVPPLAIPAIFTVQDAYDYYLGISSEAGS